MIAHKHQETVHKKDLHKLLPIDLWPLVFDFLPYKDLLNLSATSYWFLNRLRNGVERLYITKCEELHVAPTHRFPKAAWVEISCLLECAPTVCNNQIINPQVANRVVLFLSCFPSLEKVVLSGKCCHQGDTVFTTFFDPDYCVTKGYEEITRGVIHAFSGGFAGGFLSTGVKEIYGLRCPLAKANRPPTEDDCAACKDMLTSMPFACSFTTPAADLGWRSSANFMPGFMTCFTEVDVIKLQAAKRNIEDWSDWIVGLLQCPFVAEEQGEFILLDYDERILEALKYIQISLPVSLSVNQARNAILFVFREHFEVPDPPWEYRFLLRKSFEMLVAIGILPRHCSDFRVIDSLTPLPDDLQTPLI